MKAAMESGLEAMKKQKVDEGEQASLAIQEIERQKKVEYLRNLAYKNRAIDNFWKNKQKESSL